jgi:hypothetical protein
MTRAMFMRVLEDLYKASEDAETVDLLARIGAEKILRLHSVRCGVKMDKPTEAIIIFNPTLTDGIPKFQWESIIDLVGEDKENQGWLTR